MPDQIQKHSCYRIASIPGDGIGPEVIEAAETVVNCAAKAIGFDVEIQRFPWGTDFYKMTGSYIPDDGLAVLKQYDAILFGAVGSPDIPDHLSLWGLLLRLRGSMQLFANIRPIRCFTKPRLVDIDANDIDWMFIRENSEGEYSGHGGRSHIGQAWEVATDTSIFTRHGVERIMEFAFEIAATRPKKHLTVVTKSNALRHGLVLWDEVAAEVAGRFPHVTHDMMLVDAMTVRMVQKPNSIDTVVGTNLHIDILSDLAAALAGSIGIASSGNLDPTRAWPSMFEPVHGSAFDITVKGIANPIGAIWAAAEMLSWVGEETAAENIMEAIRTVCKSGQLTRDMGGAGTTDSVTKAICEAVLRH